MSDSPSRMVCAADVESRMEDLHKDRVFDFLAGLDHEFDSVRSDILRKKPLPGLEECCNIIRREFQRQETMLGRKDSVVSSSMAMVSKTALKMRPRSLRDFDEAEKDKLRCSHCNGARHTKETCFELLGYPEWFLEKRRHMRAKGKRSGQAKPIDAEVGVAAVATSRGGSANQDNSLMSLLNQVDVNESTDNPGNIGVALMISTDQDTGWVIDSGATDHMTYDSSFFQTKIRPSKDSCVTTNGDVVPVTRAGSIALNSTLSMHNVLHVPALSNHPLSVGQVTKQLECVVLMFPNFCLLRDIRTWAIIGHGTKRRGLYYIDDVTPGHVNQVRSSANNGMEMIWMWHRRLGHASFGYLKKLLPSLFHNVSGSSFKCSVCVLAKSHSASYPLSFNKRMVPFELIHSDVWGPSPISTQQGTCWFIIFVDDCTRMTWLYTMRKKIM